jgi:hypothetical protein
MPTWHSFREGFRVTSCEWDGCVGIGKDLIRDVLLGVAST